MMMKMVMVMMIIISKLLLFLLLLLSLLLLLCFFVFFAHCGEDVDDTYDLILFNYHWLILVYRTVRWLLSHPMANSFPMVFVWFLMGDKTQDDGDITNTQILFIIDRCVDIGLDADYCIVIWLNWFVHWSISDFDMFAMHGGYVECWYSWLL